MLLVGDGDRGLLVGREDEDEDGSGFWREFNAVFMLEVRHFATFDDDSMSSVV